MAVLGSTHQRYPSERGAAVVFLLLVLGGLISVAAVAIDIGHARQERWNLQKSADAAAFSAVKLFRDETGASDGDVIAVAEEFAARNGIIPSELSSGGGVEVGRWDKLTRTFDPAGTPRNSVRIRARRSVATSLGRYFGVDLLNPKTLATALGEADLTACAQPFGIEASGMIVGGTYISPGTVFTVGKGSPGNWGKLDLPSSAGGYITSNGNNFENYMLNNGVCNAYFPDNDNNSVIDEYDAIEMPASTGFSGISDVFETLATSNAQFVAAVVGDLGSGSSTTADLLRFARVQVEASTGSGGNWQGTFRVIEYLDRPEDWVISEGGRFMVE